MFAGIVSGMGRIAGVNPHGADRSLLIDTKGVALGELAAGASIAINGVCLTATSIDSDSFTADVSAETLARTTLGGLGAGSAVNLESSLKLGDSVDGHLVYGHVDGVGEVIALEPAARSMMLTIRLPDGLSRYVAVKGSITVDGVSLTVNAIAEDRFTVNIIPHTREITVISAYAAGTPVNIEVDMIARYVERLMVADDRGLSIETLKKHGFIESKKP